MFLLSHRGWKNGGENRPPEGRRIPTTNKSTLKDATKQTAGATEKKATTGMYFLSACFISVQCLQKNQGHFVMLHFSKCSAVA